MKKANSTIGLVFLILLMACKWEKRMEKTVDYRNIDDVPAKAWQALSHKKIFFGHQSVGFNIIDGIEDIKNENAGLIDWDIMETADIAKVKNGAFMHAKVGTNKAPYSKIEAFAGIMKKNRAALPDMAFFKFCFVDIHAETDTQAVFNAYQKTMKSLKDACPETTFIHVTVPLMTVQRGVKARIKKWIGKPVGGYAENIKRHTFNTLIRQTYGQVEPVYDLAAVESTYPDGNRCEFTEDGKTFYALVPSYNDDGGHLNNLGRKTAAKELLLCLAKLSGL